MNTGWVSEKIFFLPAEIVPCDAVPVFTAVKELVNLVKDRSPYNFKDLQHEIDLLLGRNYAHSGKRIVFLETVPTVPFYLHVLSVIHLSPVKVVVCVKPFSSSQRMPFLRFTRKS